MTPVPDVPMATEGTKGAPQSKRFNKPSKLARQLAHEHTLACKGVCCTLHNVSNQVPPPFLGGNGIRLLLFLCAFSIMAGDNADTQARREASVEGCEDRGILSQVLATMQPGSLSRSRRTSTARRPRRTLLAWRSRIRALLALPKSHAGSRTALTKRSTSMLLTPSIIGASGDNR